MTWQGTVSVPWQTVRLLLGRSEPSAVGPFLLATVVVVAK
jgi:hypothetical protein